MKKLIGMYKSCVTFCHLRVGVYNMNCINTRTFSVISQTSLDRNKNNNGHEYGFSHIGQNQTSIRGLHMVSRTPLFLSNNLTNAPNLKPQIRHATFMENYVNFITNNVVVKGCEDGLLYFHNVTGWPWWINIIVTALILNLTLRLPITIFTMKHEVKVRAAYKKLYDSLPQLTKDYRMEVIRRKLGPEESKKFMYKVYTEKKSQLFIEDNCHPAKAAVAEISTIPLFLGISIGFRNLSGNSIFSLFAESGAKSPELMTDGILWFPNLAIPDPYFILPVLLGIQSLRRDYVLRSETPKGKESNKLVQYSMTGLSLLFVCIATVCPSCMVLYWISNGFFANIVRQGCKLPQVRTFLKVGQPTEPVKTNPSISRFVKAINEKKK